MKLKDPQWNIALKRLGDVDLLTVTPDAIDAHPLIREYFAKQLRDTQPAAFQAAHSRLFDHLCETTPYRPDTLDGLQPLYQAVVHGCLAGRQQEACDQVYYRPHPARHGGRWLLQHEQTRGDRGRSRGGGGVLRRALEPRLPESQRSRPGLAAERGRVLPPCPRPLDRGAATDASRPGDGVQQKNWKNAAISASNLSELEVTLGRLTDAVADARQSITHADQSGDAFQRMASRTTAADALHQSGRRAEAGTLFAEAERMQKERQPQFDLLYSVRGFQYCDWLLAPAERAAWQALLRGTGFTVCDGQAWRRWPSYDLR